MACSPYPIALPIGNVSFSNGGVMRGIDVGVGSPVQSFAFLPQWPYSNSYLYDDQSPCEDHTAAYCMTYRGGLYDQSASSTSQQESSVAAAGGVSGDDAWSSDQGAWITDDLVLNVNSTEKSFPLGLAREDAMDVYGPQNVLGLGRDSTILNTLKSTGKIASRTWSMFWGWTGATPDQQSNGTFVFGGYDAAKVTGTNYTKALQTEDSRCGSGMMVTMSAIKMQYPNGSTYSLYNGSQSTALNACIGPSYPVLMTLPYVYYTVFENLCGCDDIGRSFGYNFYGMLFDPGEPQFVGNLVIEIDSSIEITIPNPQLLRPELTIDNGGALTANYSANELLINSIQQVNENDLPILGSQFLSAAMVMSNLDTNTFTLWQAGPSTSQSLVRVDEDGQISPAVCKTVDVEVPRNRTTMTASATAQLESNAAPLSSGAIAGIVVGSVVAVAGIAGLAFLLLRRRRGSTEARPMLLASLGASKEGSPDTSQPMGYSSDRTETSAVWSTDVKPPASPDIGPFEVPATRMPVELPAEYERTELPGKN